MVADMSETIQRPTKDLAVAERHEFLRHAAALYGVEPSADDVERAAVLDDESALRTLFPRLDDAEVTEALWALANQASG